MGKDAGKREATSREIILAALETPTAKERVRMWRFGRALMKARPERYRLRYRELKVGANYAPDFVIEEKYHDWSWPAWPVATSPNWKL